MQIKASFKKEMLAFSRTKKLLTLTIVFIGIAIFMPLMVRGLSVMMETMGDVYDEYGMDISTMTETLNSSAINGLANAVSTFASAGLLVYLLLINPFAGGEQKKRSIIIPRCSGLRSKSYLLPKFFIYPLAALILSVAGSIVAAIISIWAFDNSDIILSNLLLSGLLAGVYLMLYICLHLALGTATGQAGMSAAVCITASMILPEMFAIFGTNLSYNPFGLGNMAQFVLVPEAMPESGDIIMTAVIAFVIMIGAYFLALFAQNAKKIDNSGNEIMI